VEWPNDETEPRKGRKIPRLRCILPAPFVSPLQTMGHTYTRLLIHSIFSTQNRIAYLREDRRSDVFAFMVGIVREFGGFAIDINGPEDHVHLLLHIPASMAVSESVKLIKTNSSRWINEKRVLHRTFAWQIGYAAFSVSESKIDEVSRYIANQEAHHCILEEIENRVR
jgi:putative transposase